MNSVGECVNWLIKRDFVGALISPGLWLYLAWQDIRLKYRTTKIGPLWITLSMAIFIAALGAVYGQIFNTKSEEYLPFLASGFLVWSFIAGSLGEFSNVYVHNANYMKEIKINPFTILFRLVARNIIVFFHNLLILVGVYFHFRINPGFVVFIAIPGFILVVLNIVSIGVFLSLAGARFRDIAQIVQSFIQVAFFVTPIMWFPRLVPADSLILKLNPFAYYLELTRSPLLGHVPSNNAWIMSAGTLVVFTVIATFTYRYKANRIPYWV